MRTGAEMTVAALLEGTPVVAARIVGDASASIGGMALDSRRIEPGDLFCCLRGEHADGHHFAGAAVAAGAAACWSTTPLDLDAPQVVVADTRARHGPAGGHAVRPPVAADDVVGVTGTNGKTTTTALVAAILDAAGWPTRRDRHAHRLPTPRPRRPSSRPAWPSCRDEGRRAVAMEVSSHALAHAPGRRHALRGGGLHQPRPRPPRLPRDDGALLRRQGRAVRRRT